MDVRELDFHWPVIAPDLIKTVASGQLTAAHQATSYLASSDKIDDHTPTKGAIVPEAFTNVMGDGREIAPAFYGAVTNTKKAIGAGMAPGRAFEVGANFIALIAQSAISDLGRAADLSLMSAKTYTHYVRVVGGSACSRCAILAGISSAEDAFERHVHCMCTAAPITETSGARTQDTTYDKSGIPSGLFDNGENYFDSLTAAEQDRIFTNAGAEAIRNGADLQTVVNARRGAYGIGYKSGGAKVGPSKLPIPKRNALKPLKIGVNADGSPLYVYVTGEGTTARGAFARGEAARGVAAAQAGRYTRTTTLRLMPETIQRMSNGNPVTYRNLLIRYGYITP